MAEKISNSKKSFSIDWLIQGVLAKLGETFDGFTGRKWKPSSSLATSELIEKLKHLLDAKVQDLGGKGKFVPHNLKLKMQWDKFSTDSEDALKKLEIELLTAAVDHINDNRYHTFAPLKLEIKLDYFTDGVKLHASFDNLSDEASDKNYDAGINVTLPDLKVGEIHPAQNVARANGAEIFTAHFAVNGTTQKARLRFQNNQRLSVGRTRENDLSIEDTSVSKVHASLFLNSENNLTVADTGSTNGTFIKGERISYGKAMIIGNNDKVTFGEIEVLFEHVRKPIEAIDENSLPDENSVIIDGLEFKSKSHSSVELESELLNQKTSKIVIDETLELENKT
jgi:pSer/pThr/pTyr-binding forkhead associated (FHA) protein